MASQTNTTSTVQAKHVLSYLFSLGTLSPRLTILLIASQVVFAALTTTVAPLFVSQLLGQIANGSATLHASVTLLIGYAVVLFVGDVVAVRLSIFLSFSVVSKMQRVVYERMLSTVMDKSLEFHANRMSGGIVSNATKMYGAIERFWDTISFNAVPICTTILGVCIALSFVYWQYAVVLFVLAVACGLLIIRGQHYIAPYSQKTSALGSDVVAYFADTIGNISSVKAFAGEDAELSTFQQKLEPWYRANLRERRSVVLATLSFGTVLTVMNIAAFIAAIIATEYHIGNIATTYLVIVFTLNIVAQLWSVNSLTRSYIRIIGDASPMIEIFQIPSGIANPAQPEKSRIDRGDIQFDTIDFAYNEHGKHLFHQFSLHIRSGEKVGLVGHSGSGKTSLTKLLLRFNDVLAGTIKVDGQDITSISQQTLRQAVSYVSQEPTLFHRTLRENIAYGKPDASEVEIQAAAAKAHAIEFIDDLPDGLDTLVGERGVKLSGGQRQRIAIARAILKDAPILVLDEATSALDSESEKLIQAALAELMKKRTSIVIAHRLSTIAKLDRIIVLDDGKIIEEGAHSELIARGGTYAKLWSHQSGGFIDDED